MLTQKLYRNGNSIAVTIPKEYLKELSLKEGSEVLVVKDEETQAITISGVKNKRSNKSRDISLTPKFLKWLEDFNKEYGPALEELAKK
ncbi:AbrB/MazE/SpoVT family DNA-binding domain-containing protein [Candidatus Daviesbacteria bacterium]|nr:AbrB/MazE/SpoVT family DNA-binding domain-containing protein [Candidatus Daviesbacteria bacterium]